MTGLGRNHVAQTHVGPFLVSTVDSANGPPGLFETLIEGGEAAVGLGAWDMEGWKKYRKRYETRDEAEAGHALAVEWARSCVAVVDLALEILAETGEKSK